jgi:type II secretory pathway pseudopilin PulG
MCPDRLSRRLSSIVIMMGDPSLAEEVCCRPSGMSVDPLTMLCMSRGYSLQNARSRVSRGHTLVELVVVCALIAALAGISVPSLVLSHARASGEVASTQLAITLREAQARARACGEVVRVTIDSDGHGYGVDVVGPEGLWRVSSGDFGSVTCSSNYPGNGVEFSGLGWPRAIGAGVRAGTFRLTAVGATHAVVLQMGGVVRCQ